MIEAFLVGEIVKSEEVIWVRGRALQDIFVGEYLYTSNNTLSASQCLIKQIKTYGKLVDGLYAPMSGDLGLEIKGELITGIHMFYRPESKGKPR